MNARSASDWQETHFSSTLVDLHARLSLNVPLFHDALTSRIYPSGRAFGPSSAAGADHVGAAPPDDLKDAWRMPRLRQPLLAAGYARQDIQKVPGGNALREAIMRPKGGQHVGDRK